MATTMAFDTLQYVKKLVEVGVPQRQAEVQAEALADIVHERLATKADIVQLEKATKADIVQLEKATKADIIQLEKATKAELKDLEINLNAKLDTTIANLRAELIKWVLGAGMAQAAIIISCLKFIH